MYDFKKKIVLRKIVLQTHSRYTYERSRYTLFYL